MNTLTTCPSQVVWHNLQVPNKGKSIKYLEGYTLIGNNVSDESIVVLKKVSGKTKLHDEP